MGWQDGTPITGDAPSSSPGWQQAPSVEPNLEPVRDAIRFGFAHAIAVGQAAAQPITGEEASAKAQALQETGGAPKKPIDAKPARGFDDALSAGLQLSVSGLLASGKMPSKVLDEDAPMASRIAANIGTTIGDLPFMLAGGVLGGGVGGATGPGAAVTAGAGAFGLPAGLRATLVDAYTKGHFSSFSDFWERASGIIWQEVKGEITGGLTAGAGVAAKAALPATAPAAVRALGPTAAEIATMTSVGKALEGHVPNAQDFIDAAIVLGAFKATTAGAAKIQAKLQDVYVKTGTMPQQLLELAEKDPTVLPDLVSDNRTVPASLGAAVAEGAKVLPDGSIAEGGGAGPPEAPARPADVPEPSQPQQAVLDRISVGEATKRSYDWDRLYTDMKDELFPLRGVTKELAQGEPLETAADPYKLARLTRGLAGKADQFINFSPFKFDTYENVGKPLKAVIEPVKDDLDGLRAYAVARRALELDRRGIETGVPLEEAKQVVGEGAKYEPVFAGLLEYQEHLVRYLTDSGVLSKDGATAMREANRDYVPFFRLMDQEGGGRSGAGAGLSVRSPIKSIKGSERKIVDPLESIVKNTYLYTTLAERNAVGRSLVDLAEKAGREDLVKKISGPAKPVEVQAKEVQDFLDAHGIEGDAEGFTIFRRGFMNPAEDQIVVYRDGQREIYEVPKSVAAAFKGLDRESAGLLTRILAIPAKTLRAGATLSPDFMLRNFNRDQLSATVLSKNGYVPVVDFLRGMWSVARRDGDFQAWLKSGGANATMLSMDRQYLQAKLDEIAEVQGVRDRAWNVVKAPIELLRVSSELVENATRLGEFKRATGGDLSKESAQNAGFEAREVTLDFARIGAKTRSVNMITAFWNAQIEGLDRTIRAFKDDPFATTAKVGAIVTLPSVLLWWANHDDPRWKQIPDWERDLFWIVMTKDHIYRIPKPFELGVLFGSLPERILDKFVDEKPDALHNFTKAVMQVFGFNVIPTAAQPVLEHMTNHSFFTDRPLIPSNLEKLLPEYQYTPYTTEATKALGQLLGAVPGAHDSSAASPVVIDNYIRGWTGSLGAYAIQTADLALRKAHVLPDPVKPTPTLADMPVIKAFVVRYPSAQAQSIQDFNEHYQDSKKVVDTVQYLARQGEADAAMREARLDMTKMVKLDGIHLALGNAQRVIQLIDKNPNMQPDEKRQLIDAAYMQMIEMATEGEKTLRDVKRELGSSDKEAKRVAPAMAAASP